MSAQTSRYRDFLLGIVFFGTILALIYYTVILTGFSLSKQSYLEVGFKHASGLKEGDVVFVSGHQFGSVFTVEFRDDQPDDRRIHVTLEFDQPVILRQGYRIRISEFTLLGGRVVEIDPGPSRSPLIPTGAGLLGETGPSALTAMGDLVNDNATDIRSIIVNLRKLSEDLVSQQGVMGALISDPDMRSNLERTLDDVAALTEDLRSGKGTLGMLIEDDSVRDRVVNLLRDGSAAAVDLRTIVEDLAAGRGALGALLVDVALREDSAVMIRNLRDASNRIIDMLDDAANGKGLMGRFLTDEALAREASEIMHDLAVLTSDLRAGNGTIGKLLVDEEAYNEGMKALRTLNSQLEDLREAQPVSSFASMLFGASIGG